MNNFSDYDISQTHDWESPSLSPHVLLSVLTSVNRLIFNHTSVQDAYFSLALVNIVFCDTLVNLLFISNIVRCNIRVCVFIL